jgi:hypothetical protein
MGHIRESIAKAVPWIEPVLDYFDWRKRVIAIIAGAGIAAWSFVKDLAWPAIITLGFAALVLMAYALIFPAFLKLVHVGVNPRPNQAIWKHKKQFVLFQAAYLLADREPNRNAAFMDGDAAAWYELLSEAIAKKEIRYVPTMFDPQHTFQDGYHPHFETPIEASELKKFCEARGRNPEFLK